MAKKKDLNKDDIIQTAFLEWNKSCYSDMSLTTLAARLKITKPALYRHYKNKDEILNAMVAQFIGDFLTMLENLVSGSTRISYTDYLRSFIESVIRFFIHQPYYLFFITIYPVRDRLYEEKRFKEYHKKELEFISALLEFNKLNIQNIRLLQVYLFNSIIFHLIFSLHQENIDLRLPENSSLLMERITSHTELLLNGIHAGHSQTIDFETVENKSWIRKQDIINRDKIFEAITSVIAKEGVRNASLEKISAHLGMSKSNFYFYFKNKNQMFGTMIMDEMKRIKDLTLDKINSLNTFEEKLYGSMVVFVSYLIADYRTVNFFNWLHYQRFDLKKMKFNVKNVDNFYNERYVFFYNAINSGEIQTRGFNLQFITSYLNMQTVQWVVHMKGTHIEPDIKDLRLFYQLFYNGILSQRSTV